MSEKFSTYKGYPLVRCGKEIYYGYMSDPYVIWIQILAQKEVDGENMVSKVSVRLIDTNEPNPLKMVVKNAERECGLYEAIDIADVWLSKALKAK
ncbi:MAG: hypothetical protein IJN43_15800 [Ruminococcus sp.]|jgi:hypothetical protein|nr:hypothetical protein [Ruminococcus sp.]